jgi:putative transposase
MSSPRKQHSGAFKVQVAVVAIRRDRTMSKLSSEYGVHPTVSNRWKKQTLEALPGIMSGKADSRVQASEELQSRLYQEIGQLKVELDWLKKNLACELTEKCARVDFGHPRISVSRQCELLGLSRSSLYYHPVSENVENIRLMHMIDEKFTDCPFYGRRRLWNYLREKGERVTSKRVGRLMKLMGLEAIYPKPGLSRPEKWSEKHPYLLRGLEIKQPDQVWASDITYIRLAKGFVYLVAVMDWYSRYVLSWRLSVTLETDFCVEALNNALGVGHLEIFNIDQGSQFTSADFLGTLKEAEI